MVERNAKQQRKFDEEAHIEGLRVQRQWGIRTLDSALSRGVKVRIEKLGLLNLGVETEPYTEKSIDRMMAQEWGTPPTLAKPTLRET